MPIDAYNPDQESFGTIPALDSNQTPAPPAPVAEDRAKKANFGLLGKVKETYPDMYQMISDGREDILRDSIARQIYLKNILARNDVITKSLADPNVPGITPDQIDRITRRINEPDNPESIFEDHFALQYMGYIDHAKDNPDDISWVKQVQQEWPTEFEAYRKFGTHSLSTTQLLNTRLENITSSLEDEGVAQRIWNFTKSLIPGREEYALSRLVPGASLHFGLGESLQDQSLNFYRMSREQQLTTLDNVHEYLKDTPELEAQFLAGMIGQSKTDKMQNDLSLPIAVATMGIGPGAIRRAAYTAFPALAVRDFVKGMTRSVGDLSAEITAPAAAGDLARASVNRAADAIIADMATNNPVRRQIEALQSFFQGKIDDFVQNPGNYGAELANQMLERYQVAPDQIIAMLTGMMRVERVPPLRAMQDIMDQFRKHVADYLPSVDNKILNITVPYRKDTLSGNWFVDIHLGDMYGKYFNQEDAADFYAKTHNIPDYSIGGIEPTFEDTLLRIKEGDLSSTGPEINKITDPNVKAENAEILEKMRAEDAATLESRRLKDSGSGYYIRITIPWDETHPFTRNLINDGIKTNAYGSKTPESLITRFLGGILSPEKTLSLYARTQRGIATFGPNVINELATQWGKDIAQLAKGSYPWSAKREKWNDLNRVMEYGRSIPDPDNKGIPGYTFKNLGELEYAFRKTVGYSPDEQQVKAYFAWKQLNELDLTLRRLSVYRNKTRTGTMVHSAWTKGPDGEKVFTPEFDAVPQNKIPTGEGAVLVMGDRVGQERILTTRSLAENTELGKRLRGNNPTDKLQVAEIYDQYSRPLEGWGNVKNERIRYVVGKFNKRNLELNEQLPERGGGHQIYDYPFYLKQAIMSKQLRREAKLDEDGFEVSPAQYDIHYEGDNTLWAIRTRAEGRIIEERLNGIRERIRDGKIAEAKQYLIENPLPYNWEDIYEKFKPTPKRNARTGRMMAAKPSIDLNEPIRLMDNNRTIGDAFGNEYKARYGKSFVNGLRSGNPASQYQVAFTGERDARQLMSIFDDGGKGNPVFKLEPARMIDPMTSMNRGLANIANSFFFDDLKIGFMEHWLQEAAPFMDLRKNELQNSMYTLFHNPKWIKRPNSDQLDRIKQLEIARSQHLNLVSRPGEQESYLLSAAQHLSDAMYTKLGPKFIISPMSIVSMAKDGPTFLRNMAFHYKLGMFNPSQLLKQLNTWATIYGIEGPTRASQGAIGAMLHELSRLNDNPGVLAHLDSVASKFGWRPGEWQEFRDFMMNTGFDTVAGEYAARDSIWSGKIYSSGINRFLSLGSSFFTEGERNVRYGAFATAYRRFRDAHPTGPLSDADKEVILQRARLLNVNMDRAANAIWQHGLSSIPFQFQTYALRTAELMFGKALTTKEKARLFATYFTLYGFPTATALYGLPFADNLRKTAIDNGYEVGNGYISNTLMEGVPAMIGSMITGNRYNIGQVYGPSGLFNYNEYLRSDQTFWQAILSSSLGPSGSILANTWSNSDGLRRWGMNIYNDEFPFQWEDVARLFKEISAIRMGDQNRMALQTGNWYSTRGTKLATDINPMDAILMTLTGLSHQSMADSYLTGQQVDDRKKYNEYTEQVFIENWRNGIRAAVDGAGYNPNQADEYFKRAGMILKMRAYPIEDYSKLLARATQDYETLAEKMNKEYNLQHRPSGREQELTDRYISNTQRKQ